MAAYSAVLAFALLTSVIFSIASLTGGERPSQDHSVNDIKASISLLAVSIGFGVAALILLSIRLLVPHRIQRKTRLIIALAVIFDFIEAVTLTMAITLALTSVGYSQDEVGTWLLLFGNLFQYLSILLLLHDAWHYFKSWQRFASLEPISTSQLKFLGYFILLEITIVVGGLVFSALEGWTYRQSVFFSIVSLTTIGYGFKFVPRTNGGKLFLMFYGIFGLGLVAFMLSKFAQFLMTSIVKPLARRCHLHCDMFMFWVPWSIVILVLMMLAVWLGGALVFTIAEDWSYLDASYYCFQTLATIGYGDILPSTGFGLAFAFFFAFTGLGLFAAVVNGLWSGDLLI